MGLFFSLPVGQALLKGLFLVYCHLLLYKSQLMAKIHQRRFVSYLLETWHKGLLGSVAKAARKYAISSAYSQQAPQ